MVREGDRSRFRTNSGYSNWTNNERKKQRSSYPIDSRSACRTSPSRHSSPDSQRKLSENYERQRDKRYNQVLPRYSPQWKTGNGDRWGWNKVRKKGTRYRHQGLKTRRSKLALINCISKYNQLSFQNGYRQFTK